MTNGPFLNLLCNYAKNGIQVGYCKVGRGIFLWYVVMLALLHVVAFSVG